MTVPIRNALEPDAPPPYFAAFEKRVPPHFPPTPPFRQRSWQVLAGVTVGLGLWYLHWRWTVSLNSEALLFSTVVAGAETVAFFGSLLFFHDIWCEGDSLVNAPPANRTEAALDSDGPIKVDVFIATYNEGLDILQPTIAAARDLVAPPGVEVQVHLLDDGRRSWVATAAMLSGVGYITRDDNRGFKAGNLCSALLRTGGDFIVICDADTRLFPGFLHNTLGYFRDASVAWVQTPHWFYDIPEGTAWGARLTRRFGRRARVLAGPLRWLSGRDRTGADPFLSDPSLFFDVIQRRRNRNGASFCCGAGSIHRREPLFEAALRRQGEEVERLSRRLILLDASSMLLLRACTLQVFRHHVSEDLYTSIVQHKDRKGRWKSVYHPQVESRMLSPWSMDAWAVQKLKYAGGTFDIMLRDNPLFRRGMPWQTRLHYAATFWSYLSILWLPVLLMAPVVSMFTGIAPVRTSSVEFFLHLLPLLVVNELALVVGCNGHNPNPGRVMAITTLPIQWRAFAQVLRGDRPTFPTTPKSPGGRTGVRYIWPHLIVLGVMAASAIWGVAAVTHGSRGDQLSLVIVNLFWLSWSGAAVAQIVIPALWIAPKTDNSQSSIETSVLESGSKSDLRVKSPQHAFISN